jgi:hypothetical protein
VNESESTRFSINAVSLRSVSTYVEMNKHPAAESTINVHSFQANLLLGEVEKLNCL